MTASITALTAHRRDRRNSLSAERALRITELAERAGTTARALRYYEHAGLLTPLRNRGNLRFYTPSLVQTACLIADLRRLGVAVPEIAAFLAEIEGGRSDGLEVLVRRRLAQLDRQRETLTALMSRLCG